MADDRTSRITHRTYLSYIDKSREYYAAQGYTRPYRWARHGEVSFVRPQRPLADMRVGVVTTGQPWNPDNVDGSPSGPKEAMAVPASPVPDRVFTSDLFWDKEHTSTDDLGSFLPLEHLAALAAEGTIGSVSDRFYCVPTEYSQRRTREQDGPDVARWCAEDGVDLAILIPL